ncbi:MAG: hypothetical protein ABSC47_09890 [Terracidiphilus sp.]|jgi:hypothetical protein
MATESVVPKPDESAVEAPKAAPKAAYVKKTYSPEFLAEQAAIDKRVREEGAKRIRRSCERLIALGIVDKDGNRIKKELPADMQPGADRDFGG